MLTKRCLRAPRRDARFASTLRIALALASVMMLTQCMQKVVTLREMCDDGAYGGDGCDNGDGCADDDDDVDDDDER